MTLSAQLDIQLSNPIASAISTALFDMVMPFYHRRSWFAGRRHISSDTRSSNKKRRKKKGSTVEYQYLELNNIEF
jgi:hypothetical protein